MKLAGGLPDAQTSYTNEVSSDMIAYPGNPFLIGSPKLDDRAVTEEKDGFIPFIQSTKSEERTSSEEMDPSQFCYGLGCANSEDTVKGSESEDEHMELPHFLPATAVDKEVPYFVVHHSNPFLDDENCINEKYGLILPAEGVSSAERESSGHNEESTQNDKKHTDIRNPNAADVDTDCCMDKMVTKSEMEVSKDGPCSVVKDICVDEGAHSLEKIVIENKVENENVSIEPSCFATDDDHDMIKQKTRTTMPDLHYLKSSLVNGHAISIFNKDATEDIFDGNVVEARDKLDASNNGASNAFHEKNSSKEFLPLDELDADLLQVKSSSFECSKDLKQSIGENKIDQDEKGNSLATVVFSAAKEFKTSNGPREAHAETDVDSGVISFNFDSGVTNIDRAENKEDKVGGQPNVRALHNHGTEDTISDGGTSSARSSFVHHNRGGSGFSGSNFLLDPVASSGRIPFSGSISYRSDSSTTSACSFAFPVLQSEWNSSPVKMAKADRRRLRKQRCWRMGLLCCRF